MGNWNRPQRGYSIRSEGTWVYAADSDAYDNATTDSFTIQFTDGNGFVESQVITVDINDVNTNTAPVAENVTITCVIGAGCYPEASVSDPDNDTLTYSIIEQGVPGSTMTPTGAAEIDTNTGVVNYAPTGNAIWNLGYTIKYQVSDGTDTDNAYITIGMTAVDKYCTTASDCMQTAECCQTNSFDGTESCKEQDAPTIWQCIDSKCAVCDTGCVACTPGGTGGT